MPDRDDVTTRNPQNASSKRSSQPNKGQNNDKLAGQQRNSREAGPDVKEGLAKGEARKQEGRVQAEGDLTSREGQQRLDKPVLAEDTRADPNRTVRGGGTAKITGHSCPKVCQKLGFANCRCKEKDNIRRLFIAMTILIEQLIPLHWKVFSKKPVWLDHPHHHQFRFGDINEEEAIAETDPMDLLLFDPDYHDAFELTDDPFLLILRSTVPADVLSREFEIFMKQLMVELPDVQNVQELVQRGYQMRHDPQQGLTAIRMPHPEHQMMFMQHLCRKGCLAMAEHQVLSHFSRMMQARYGRMQPKPEPSMRSKDDLYDKLEQARYPYNPLKMTPTLEPKS